MPSTHVDGFHNADAAFQMKYNLLGNTGLEVSVLGFGASSLGSVFHNTDQQESIDVVSYAVKHGINLIDTAPWYGHGKSETVLGEALKGIPREAFYLSTKVGRYLPQYDRMFDFSAQRTLQSVDESLQRLGLDYVDIIQVHDVEFAPTIDVIINETLPALQKVKENGKARFIGITGYPLNNFRCIIERSPVKVDTVLTYCHGCMNDNSLADFIPYFKEKGIGIINASPIAMGLLSNRGPPSWHPAGPDIRDACSKAASFCQVKNVDISRLAIHFTLNQPDIPTTLVSTARLENMKRNLETHSLPLSGLEEETFDEVMEKFMKPLNDKTWEGVEVSEYWQQRGLLSEQVFQCDTHTIK